MKKIILSLSLIGFLTSCGGNSNNVSPTNPTTDSSYISINYPGGSNTIKKENSTSIIYQADIESNNTGISIRGVDSKTYISIECSKGGTSIIGTYYLPTDSIYHGLVDGTFSVLSPQVSYQVIEDSSKLTCNRFDSSYIGGNYDLYTKLGGIVYHITGLYLVKR